MFVLQKSLTVEEFDNIREVHCVGQDDVPVGFEKRQSNEQHHVLRGYVAGSPNQLPGSKHLIRDLLDINNLIVIGYLTPNTKKCRKIEFFWLLNFVT